MVIDGILRKLNQAGYSTEGFVDDLIILILGKYENTLCSLMNSALKIAQKWCNENGLLSVNPQKTKPKTTLDSKTYDTSLDTVS